MLLPWLPGADLIIAADGGANLLADNNVSPDVVIGDLDGIDSSVLASLPAEKVVHIVDQNLTDCQKALRHAEGLQATDIVVFGAEGTRIDHSLSALYSAGPYQERARIRLVFERMIAHCVGPGNRALETRPSLLVSLLPALPTRVRRAEGLEFPVDGLELLAGGRDGVSNRSTGEIVKLEIESGSLLVFVGRFEGDVSW